MTGPDEPLLDEPFIRSPTSQTRYFHEPDDMFTREGIHLASIAEKKRLWWKNATINTLFIGSWYADLCASEAHSLLRYDARLSSRFSFATVLSVYNKWMFSTEHFGFPFPLFVTAMHMFIQFILAALMRNIWPTRFRPDYSPSRLDYV
jgi:solute carrier family 35, member C2